MPLEPIVRPPDRRIDRWKARIVAGLAMLAVVICLAGCAEGTARDAERARDREAGATSAIDTLQSTRTTEIITGTPATPSTP